VGPDFSKACRVPFFSADLKEVRDAMQEERVVVVVGGNREFRSLVVEADSL
jgi:hypothetical protein